MPVIYNIAGMQLESKDVAKMKKLQGVSSSRELVPPVKSNKEDMIQSISLKAKKLGVSIPKNLKDYTVPELQKYFANCENFKVKALVKDTKK